MAEIASLMVNIGADLKDIKSDMSEFKSVIKKTSNDIKNQFGSNFSNQIGGAIAGAFALSTLIDFGKEVINITAEFQKFEAVLTNTLGSNSEAQAALLKIQDLAAKTPFSVRELTEAYVQLANRGIEPSSATMTKMGDVAATLGKDIKQLNEAILDVSNSERWNELGIKVKVNGDKMIGTFRGMKVEVDKTEKGALKMIETFGEMEGVAGSMAGVSQTLGGKLSNLGDSFDQLYNTIGNLTQGPIVWFIDGVNDMLQATSRLLKSQEQLDKESHLKNIGKEVEELTTRYNQLTEDAQKYQNLDESSAKLSAYQQLSEEFKSIIALRQEEMDLISKEGDEVVTTDRAVLDSIANRYKLAKQGQELAQAQLDALEKIKNGTNAESAATQKAKKAKEEYTGIIAIEKRKLEELEKARLNAGTAEEVGKYNQLISVQKEAIEVLEDYSIAVEQANLTKLSPSGFDTNTIMKPFESLPETFSSTFYKDLTKEIEIATNKNLVFGDSFDLVGEKAAILTDAINYLLENGVSPASPMIEELKTALLSLGETAQQVVINISGPLSDMVSSLAEAFGELAVGAASVDDFGKTILMAMGDFVGQLGKMMIATGIARLALEQVLENPYGAIAAGAALVALGAATKAVLKKGPSSSPSISAGPQKNSNGFGSASAYLGYNSMTVQVEGTIRGRDLQISNSKTSSADKRFGK